MSTIQDTNILVEDVTEFQTYQINWTNSYFWNGRSVSIFFPANSSFSKGWITKKEGNSVTQEHDLSPAKAGIPVRFSEPTYLTLTTSEKRSSHRYESTSNSTQMVGLSIINLPKNTTPSQFFQTLKTNQVLDEEENSIVVLKKPSGFSPFSYGSIEKYMVIDDIVVKIVANNLMKFSTQSGGVENLPIFAAIKKIHVAV